MSYYRFTAMLLAFCFVTSQAGAQAQEPWEEPQDPAQAINDPDRYVWRLFVAVNWPADVKQKKADASKKFGDPAPGLVVWETWRNASNNAPDTAYPKDGSDPGAWLGIETPADKPIASFDAGSLQQQVHLEALKESKEPLPAFDEELAELLEQGIIVNETRLNQATYEFLRANKLYNVDEQITLFTSGRKTIEFPVAAKETKAQWREIKETDKPRYHWVKSTNGKLYGLTALHITTKDLPNWFWATFEHIDNKLKESEGGHAESEGWLAKSRDRIACPQPPHDCEKIPTGFGLEATKWENYRLRGTQIDFVDSRGEPTRLANSQPEGGFQLTSSCITCHARATIGAGKRLSIFKCDRQGNVGTPSPDRFTDAAGVLKFTQLDFVWSLFRARRSDGTGVSAGDGACRQDPACASNPSCN